MATIVRKFTRSASRQIRQPRLNPLLLKPKMNPHLKAIYQRRRFSEDQDGEKFCIDYKKNPCIEGHEPPDLPKLQPSRPQLRIAKRREFMQRKKCKELEKDKDDPCASFSGFGFIWEEPKVRVSSICHKMNIYLMHLSKLRSHYLRSVYLNHERMYSKKVDQEQACFAAEPVSPQNQRMARKRKYFLAMQKKEAEAKVKALAQLKHACHSNSQTKEDLKIDKSNSDQAKKKADSALSETSNKKKDLKQLMAVIKERCRRKRKEYEKSREAECKKKAEEADLRNNFKMARIRKLCEEAKKTNASKMARLKQLSEVAQLRKQLVQAKLRNQFEEVKLRRQLEEVKLTKQLVEAKLRNQPEEAASKKESNEFEEK